MANRPAGDAAARDRWHQLLPDDMPVQEDSAAHAEIPSVPPCRQKQQHGTSASLPGAAFKEVHNVVQARLGMQPQEMGVGSVAGSAGIAKE